MTTPLRLLSSTVLALTLAGSGAAQEAAPAPAQGEGEPPPPAPSEEFDPWRLQSLIGEESWLKVSGETRIRYEGLEGQYRSASRLDSSDHLGFQRTLLRADADLDLIGLTVEVLDGRHYGGGFGSALNTGNVNTVDFLQAFVDVDLGGLGSGEHRVRAGRQTIDLGSRRLVARNGYRNTINSYTGVDWRWEGEESAVEVFWTMPVRRKPFDRPSVVSNEIELDEQDVDRQFMGVFYERELSGGIELDVYTFFLWDEEFLKRELLTPGFHLQLPDAPGQFDFEFEYTFQIGNSRQIGQPNTDLDHIAWFTHGSVGYTFDTPWQPRVRAAFDYATGDRDRGDDDNGRYSSLFGARRFEFGPTGIYGPIARTNLLSPDVRIYLQPREKVRMFAAWRGFWLARKEDVWLAAGIVDPTGQSGRHVGQQFEGAIRWDLPEKNLRLEVGGVHMFHGSYQARAPGGRNTDQTYAYAQMRWQF